MLKNYFAILISISLAFMGLHTVFSHSVPESRSLSQTDAPTALWQSETVDDSSSAFVSVLEQLAVDSDGRPHLLYQVSFSNSNHIRYTWWSGDAWEMQFINDIDDNFGSNEASMTLAGNTPHFSYSGFADNLLRLMYQNHLGITDTIDADTVGLGRFRFPSMSVDTNGIFHIAYTIDDEFSPLNALRYASGSPGSWHTETVSAISSFVPSDYFLHPTLAVEADGTPHIVYQDLPGNINYAWLQAGNWQTETIGISTWNSSFGLALDSNNQPHVSYTDEMDMLHYTHRSGSSWNDVTIPTISPTVCSAKIAVDGEDAAHIVYNSADRIGYIHWNGSAWEEETVADNLDTLCAEISLVLDNDNELWVAYLDHDGVAFDLKLAKRVDSVATVIDTTGGIFTPTTGTTFTFPAGAFTEPVTVTYRPLDPISHTLPHVGIFFELTAVFTNTGLPAQLQPGFAYTTVIQYDPENLPSNVSETGLALFHYTPESVQLNIPLSWDIAEFNWVNTTTNQIMSMDGRLGIWGLFGQSGYSIYLPVIIKPSD